MLSAVYFWLVLIAISFVFGPTKRKTDCKAQTSKDYLGAGPGSKP